MNRTIGLGCVGLLGVLTCLAVACSGTDTTTVVGNAPDAAGAGDAGTADGAIAYTLDNVCELTGPKLCAQRSTCCASMGGLALSGCVAYEKSNCEKNVAEVKAGTMTFDGSKIDACLEKLAPFVSKCGLDFSDVPKLTPIINGCTVFSGQLGEQQPCERDSQCKPSTTSDAFVTCNSTTKKCTTTRFLVAGATCEFKDGLSATCGAGLYCDIPAGAAQGTCKTALSLGASCTHAKPLECALGAYCNAVLKCAPGQAGTAPCENFTECASLKCTKVGDAGTGTCEPLAPPLKPAECGH